IRMTRGFDPRSLQHALTLAAFVGLGLVPAASHASPPRRAPRAGGPKRVASAAAAKTSARLERITLTPESRVMGGPEARQTLVVDGYYSDGSVRDVTPLAKFSSRDASIVKLNKSGVALAVGDGKTDVTAEVSGQTGSARFEVKGTKDPFTWSFRNQVISVL